MPHSIRAPGASAGDGGGPWACGGAAGAVVVGAGGASVMLGSGGIVTSVVGAGESVVDVVSSVVRSVVDSSPTFVVVRSDVCASSSELDVSTIQMDTIAPQATRPASNE